VVNDRGEQEKIRSGIRKEASIRFLDLANDSGKMICPSYQKPNWWAAKTTNE